MQGFFDTFALGWSRICAWWIHLQFWEQEALKMALLVIAVLFTVMVLGDIYRGEIQNRFFKIKLISFPGAVLPTDRELMWIPKDLTEQQVDRIRSHVTFFLHYRDCFGIDRRAALKSYGIRFRVRYARFQTRLAADLEHDHRREVLEDTDEQLPSNAPPRAEIVALYQQRAAEVTRERKEVVKDMELKAEQMRNSFFARALRFKSEKDIHDPKTFGIEARFNFPINPYFILYRHPDRDLRATAWLTVLTSLFALVIQLLFGYESH